MNQMASQFPGIVPYSYQDVPRYLGDSFSKGLSFFGKPKACPGDSSNGAGTKQASGEHDGGFVLTWVGSKMVS